MSNAALAIPEILDEVSRMDLPGAVLVFGSAARPDGAPGDVDLVVDLRPMTRKEYLATDKGGKKLSPLLHLAAHRYGWVDPFVRFAGDDLVVRSDDAQRWIKAANAKQLMDSMDREGIPLAQARSLRPLPVPVGTSAASADISTKPGNPLELTDVIAPNGRPVAENFQAWFRNSKVVDAEGKPLVVYHGTQADFTAFDFSRIGRQGRAEGAGFYFTSSHKVASGYGKTMEVYLSLQKPLAYDTQAFSIAVLQKLVMRLAELESQGTGNDIADGYLSNFGDVRSEGLQPVLREAARHLSVDETALDQISGIVGSGVNPQYVNRATLDVTGYDGVVVSGFSNCGDAENRIYVAFFPEQIKSATANTGDYSLTNACLLDKPMEPKAQKRRGPRP